MAEEKILLVDDEVEFTAVLAERMQNRGLDVDTVESGEAAIEAVRKEDFCLIILDLSMPGMDGLEALKRMRAEKPELQIIVLTGQGTIEKGVEAMKLGALDFLEKPADITAIMEKFELAKGKRKILMTKQFQERINEILKKKGW